MRRHPLIGRPVLLLGGAFVALLLVVVVAVLLMVMPAAAANVTITSAPGETLVFQQAEATVRAGGPITITFQNGSSLSHNLVFTGGVTGATRTIVEPGGFDEILLGQMNPGTYPFVCTIHDGMVGTLTVLDRAGDLGPTDPSEGRVTHRSRKATGR